MAKYLQDIYIDGPKPSVNFSNVEEERFYAENGYLWASINLIQDLYNYNFPSKYSTPDSLWRLFICITTDPNLDLTKDGFENWFYLDLAYLKSLDETNRKVFLFQKVSNQIIRFCKKSNYSFTEFEEVNKIIGDKNILFDEPHKKEKSSADRKHKAFIWRKYDEFEKATYIKVIDRSENTVLFKRISDLHFSHFDRISWQDNETILVYKISQYSGFKQADDYYKISLNGSIEFKPQTKEEICYYGVELMRDPETFDKGLEYIRIADKMNHGKAKNILLNLKLKPVEKNVDLLMQQPRKPKGKIG
jgi:hypothetical protein